MTPGLVGDLPRIEALLVDAGYEHRTTARPGLWGREPYDERDGTRSFREQIDLSLRTHFPALPAEASAESRRCNPRTGKLLLAMLWVWSLPRSTGRL